MPSSPYLAGPVQEAFEAWHQKLHHLDGSWRAARAQLKRCHGVGNVLLEPAFQRLYRHLEEAGTVFSPAMREAQMNGWAAAAALAAHVSPGEGRSFPVMASHTEKPGERPPLSPLRFRRLLDTPDDDIDALFKGLRRALPLIGGKVSAISLAADVLSWGDETRRRWAYAYHWPDEARS